MSLAALEQALNGLTEHPSCSGTAPLRERFAIALPDGDVGAIDDPRFLEWLHEHAEPAPFGHANKTRRDPAVRLASRLVARGAATIVGFDPADALAEIEAAMSPRWHLEARLLDVIVYPEGGQFRRHKDTPRGPDLVGTLVVGLPIEHAGGAFIVDDGRTRQTHDWSGPVDRSRVRWVALFSDVDHAIEPVTAGARVTLVYSLVQTARPRPDPTWEQRLATLRTAFGNLASQSAWPVMIACTRHVIAEDKQPQPRPITTLRGIDRDLADALGECGYNVAVRECLAACQNDGDAPPFPTRDELYTLPRLKKPVAASTISGLELLTFAEDPEGDEGEDLSEFSIAPFILDEVPIEQWVIRERAAATLLHESDCFSESGYFGNEAYGAYIYSLAALEVTHKRG